jgi:hypothetical protein
MQVIFLFFISVALGALPEWLPLPPSFCMLQKNKISISNLGLVTVP